MTTTPTQTVERTSPRQRLHRSELAVPGSNVKMLERAPAAGADIVMLDLEDAVAPDDKAQARLNVIDALRATPQGDALFENVNFKVPK